MSGGNVVAPFNMFDAPVLPYNHLDSDVPPTPLGDNSVGMESVYTSGRRGLARGLSEDHHVEIDQNAMHLEPILAAIFPEILLILLALPKAKHKVQQRKLLYKGLYLLIWGEAANIEFVLYGMLTGNISIVTRENVKPSYGGEEEPFLQKVI
ncbi:1,3-beta-glucan synthase subunit FKS1-like, domain-1 [Artemisia annua]|uniref:1,3-beta-glucan synthase subunit FKS1-like, domain-1 n=1 Tax=Artemisia annua TaxID=35608 RepID=A0A2U1PBV9_ARTAN|nr:1,3-beta-glucan synthase subunit FKS1-like, domain-1 [Artemisia annua]